MPQPIPPLITLAPEGDVLLDICDSSPANENTNHRSAQYLVASQVLCAASPVFSKMFSRASPFAEAVSLRDQSRQQPVTVELDDNPGAFQVVLNTLHFRNRHVTKVAPLRTMLAIAKIIDKYHLHEALMLLTNSWQTAAKNMDVPLPEKLIMAWAFRYEELFTEATSWILQRGSWVPGLGLVFQEEGVQIVLSECLPECLIGMFYHGLCKSFFS
jgi:hypothetical protein